MSLLQLFPITLLGLWAASLASAVAQMADMHIVPFSLALRSVSSPDDLQVPVLNNHISPFGYDVA